MTGCDSGLSAYLEYCLAEISHPRHMTWYFTETHADQFRFIALVSQCWAPRVLWIEGCIRCVSYSWVFCPWPLLLLALVIRVSAHFLMKVRKLWSLVNIKHAKNFKQGNIDYLLEIKIKNNQVHNKRSLHFKYRYLYHSYIYLYFLWMQISVFETQISPFK